MAMPSLRQVGMISACSSTVQRHEAPWVILVTQQAYKACLSQA